MSNAKHFKLAHIVSLAVLTACAQWTSMPRSGIASDSVIEGPVRVITMAGDTIQLANIQVVHDTVMGPLLPAVDSAPPKRIEIPTTAIKTIDRRRGAAASAFSLYLKWLDIVAIALVIPTLIYVSQ